MAMTLSMPSTPLSTHPHPSLLHSFLKDVRLALRSIRALLGWVDERCPPTATSSNHHNHNHQRKPTADKAAAAAAAMTLRSGFKGVQMPYCCPAVVISCLHMLVEQVGQAAILEGDEWMAIRVKGE